MLTGAYEYIEKLQRQVQQLHSEFDAESCSDDDHVSSCEGDSSTSCTEDERPVDSNSAFEWSCASRRGRSRARVGFGDRLLFSYFFASRHYSMRYTSLHFYITALRFKSRLTRVPRLYEQVEVVSTGAGLRIRVDCDKRPSLLADIMKVLESRGLNVEEASVAFEERFVLDCVGSVVSTDPKSMETAFVGCNVYTLEVRLSSSLHVHCHCNHCFGSGLNVFLSV